MLRTEITVLIYHDVTHCEVKLLVIPTEHKIFYTDTRDETAVKIFKTIKFTYITARYVLYYTGTSSYTQSFLILSP